MLLFLKSIIKKLKTLATNRVFLIVMHPVFLTEKFNVTDAVVRIWLLLVNTLTLFVITVRKKGI